jgi:hypothetical protein
MGLLLLPIHLAFALVFGVFMLPFLILRFVFKLLAALIVFPFVILFVVAAALVAVVAMLFAILAPLLPFAVIALLIYAVMRHSPAATVARG